MPGFQVLNKNGDGLVVSKPCDRKNYVLYIKTMNVLEQVAVFSNDEAVNKLKDKLIIMGLVEV